MIQPPNKPLRKRIARVAIWVAVGAFVFGWLLPRFIDYEQVWAAIESLTRWQFVLMLAVGLARVPTEALIYRALLPDLGLWRGTEAYLSSNLVAQFIPPPGAEAVRFAYYRAEGYDAEQAATGALGSFIFPTAGRLVLPLPAFVLLLATGELDWETLLVSAIALAVLAVLGVLTWLVTRSERSARRVGIKLQRPASWIAVKCKREPINDLGERSVRFSTNAVTAIKTGWKGGTVAVALNLFLTYLILLLAVRFVGIDSGGITSIQVFAAFALAFWAGAVFPITGSGLGVIDAVLIGTLSGYPRVSENAVVAAVFLWRIFYTLITLPLGAVTLARFKKANPDVLRAKPERSGDKVASAPIQ